MARPGQTGGDRERLLAGIAADPGNIHLRRSLAVHYARSGDPGSALDQFRHILDLSPNEPDAAADAGLMARRCGREQEVFPLVRSAADAHPGHAKLWQVLGLMHRGADDLDPALAAFDRAAALAPADPLVAHSRARTAMEAGRSASDLYASARRLAPADQMMIMGHAAALVAEQRPHEALALMRSELVRDPNWAAGHALLARLLWSLGEKDAYTRLLEDALARFPKNMDLWREMIVALLHAGNHRAALDLVDRGRAAAGDHLLFDVNEAVCRSDLGEVEAADRLFNRLSGTREPTLMVRHIRHLIRTGRPESAEPIALSMTGTPVANDFWPYLSIIWRLTGNPLWEWLEGDERLVGVFDLASAVGSIDKLAECLRRLHVTTHQPLDQSLRGGTQTDGYLFARTEPEIRALRAAIVDAVTDHVAQLPPHDSRHPQLGLPRTPIRFSGAWSVRLTSGGRHANHLHPDGWFSSAFYVALPEPEQRGPEPAGWLALGEPEAELGLELAPFRLIEPQPGRLALFPSTMWHGTRPFERGERLTVAFDVARQIF
jgi:tetratricopeptide (TPR) repeat protein